MTAPPPSATSSRMDWHGTNGPPPPPPQHPYHAPSSYDAYNPPRGGGPPLTPGPPYHPGAGGYSPHRPATGPRIYPPKYWHEHHQQRHPPQPPHYGPPYDGPPPSPYHVESGRQGPPPPPGYADGRSMPLYDNYYNQRRDMYHPAAIPPPSFRTPPSHHLRRDGGGGSESASVTNSASFSSKEEHPEVETRRTIPPKSSDWEPTRSTTGKGEKGKKQGDPLSMLAKAAMEPSRSDQLSKETDFESKEVDRGETLRSSSSKDEADEALRTRLRSSPIVAPDSTDAPPPSSSSSSSVKQPPPPIYREASYQPPSTSTGSNSVATPKPITPTGVTHYGHPPSSSTSLAAPSHPPPSHRPNISRVNSSGGPYGHFEDRGPYPPPYGGMTPPHRPTVPSGSSNFANYGPPPPGTYPSGYDSRSGSWEQSYVPPPNQSPAVVEERNSFDSYESSGNSRSSSSHNNNYYQYYPTDYSRDPRGYPPPSYPPSSHGNSAWQLPPPDPRAAAGYPPYPGGGGGGGWGHGGGYEGGPTPSSHQHHGYPPPGYPTPPHHMTPPRGMMGGPPPTPPYYDERPSSSSSSGYPQHHHVIHPSPYGAGPPLPLNHHSRPPYPYMHPPNRDEKTVLRKKFSWKHFPELERFLIENRDDYLKYSNRNYTVEQKQFNNTLTERLIVLAEKHGYVFDPEEFNFVAIRDRIRCYYKSYVQTARKRGLMLPTDRSPSSLTANAISGHAGGGGGDLDDDDENQSNDDEEHTVDEGVEVDENGIATSSSSIAVEVPVPTKGDEEDVRE